MQGKTIVITGATSGIGEVAALQLAQQGARIVAIARDRDRGEETLRRLRGAAPAQDHIVHYADLSRLSEMKRVAAEISAAQPRIDVLINNAGALFTKRELTEDGLERTFATNHMAYFVVTNQLSHRLRATRDARVVCTASDAHKGAKLNFDDLQSERGFSGFSMYGRSKLMNILFTRELARRLAGTGVTANCLHPGFVATRFGDAGGGLMAQVIRVAKKFALTPQEGAQTILYLASSPEVAGLTGQYFYKSKPAVPTTEAQNDADARRLWEVSANLSGVGT